MMEMKIAVKFFKMISDSMCWHAPISKSAMAVFAIILLNTSLTAQNFSEVTTSTIPALTNAKTHWMDMNNDDLPDLFITGTESGGIHHTAVYTNNGDNTFNTITLMSLKDVAFDFGDYNKDGYIDIILSGINSTEVKKTLVYRNDGGTGFTAQNFSIGPLARGGILWNDFDHDADPDILLTGFDGLNQHTTLLYEYTGNDYTLKTTSLPAVANGTLLAFDANNDGETEVLITGLNTNGNSTASVYTIHSDFTTSLYTDQLDGTAFNAVASGDYNGDGFTDLVIAGLTEDLSASITTLLSNNGVNGFVATTSGLQNVSSSSVELADINNDGMTDIILAGIDDASLKYFKYYTNNAGSFTDIGHSMKNIYNGDVSAGDYDNDGDLDLFQIGNSDINFEANLYSSDQSAVTGNNAPGVPANLTANVNVDSVSFTWDNVADDHTSTNSISYNVFISRNAIGTDLFLSPLSNIDNGYVKIPKEGNAGYRNTISFKNLPEGRYYWGVQAVDNGFRGSSFAKAPEQTFAVCYPVSLGADITICNGDYLNLSMGTTDDVVNWYSKANGPGPLSAGSNTLSHEITQNDTIIVELTRPFNCTVRDTLIVHVSNPLTIDLGADTAICSGDLYSATITSSAKSANWYNPDGLLAANQHHYEYVVLSNETIIAEVFNADNCVSYDTIVVDVLSLPQFDLGADTSICDNEDLLLEVSNSWSRVDWLSGNTILASDTNRYLLHVDDNKTIRAKVTDWNNCVNYDILQVNAFVLPEITIGSDTAICYQQNIQLSISSTSNTINWYSEDSQLLASNTLTYSFQVLQGSTIIAQATDNNNCINYDSIFVDVLSLPQFSLGADTAICLNNNIILKTGAGFAEVNWYSKNSGQPVLEGSWFYNYSVQDTDTLIAEVFSTAGCVNYDSIRIERLALPIFSLGDDRNVCTGDSLQMEIPGSWQTVNWYTNDNTILQQNNAYYRFKVEQDAVLWAEVFNTSGCVEFDTIAVNALSLPVFTLGDDKTFCNGDTVEFAMEDSGTSYSWRNSNNELLASTKDYDFIISELTTLSLTVGNDDLCQYSDTITLSVNPLPDFAVEGSLEVCEKDTLTLSVDHPSIKSIFWFNNTNIVGEEPTLNTLLPETSDITARLTDTNNCTTEKTFLITVNPRPLPDAGPDTLLCYGESIVIGKDYGSSSDLEVQWSPATFLSNDKIGNPIASPENSTTYVVTLTSAKGCSASDSVYLEVNPKILVDAGANVSICIGDSLTLGGSPTASGSQFAYTYQWMTSESSLKEDEPNPVVAPTASTTYFVLVSSGKCEVEYDSIIVTVNPLPTITVINDKSIGAGGSAELFASGGQFYSWSPIESLNDSQIANPVASPMKTTDYKVTVTDENNCTNNGEVTVLVQNQLFIPNLFTPNGDGKNDVFLLYGSGVKEISLSIFDLKGKKVYHTKSVEEAFAAGWNGTYSGKALQNDTYIWTIEGTFHNGDPVLFEGKNSGIIKLIK